ncbi:hypothetical protein FRACA_1020024 [Frankia canadensis]|uniref:Uncharacterized protein n=1 Tax=Frankia canadensis TaxID=1836972 RepID=A0A2I2KIS8_9ACTN|nr:hypothetical protein FRACA_1020024 [Frankia canadensis]SOU52856.1 hypothetical protein FRACA_1020024 [Frankia canadensis]
MDDARTTIDERVVVLARPGQAPVWAIRQRFGGSAGFVERRTSP